MPDLSAIGASRVDTAGEKAYRRLRSDIIFGRLAPSQKLRLEGLKMLTASVCAP